MGREQLLNQIASGSGSPSRSSTTKTTSNSDSKAAGRDRLLKQIGGYGSKTALDEDKYSEFENLYNQYESDVSGIYDSYNARTEDTGYKADAQDFYDKTMAATTAAKTSGSALTDWLKENRGSFSYEDYTELLDAVKQNDTGLSKILDATKNDVDFYGQFKDADDYDFWTGYQDAIKKYEQPAAQSMVAYNEDGSFNAWQTMLNAVQGGKDLLKETKAKETGERFDADLKGETRTDALGIRRDVMKDYKAAGGKTVKIGGKDVALDAALYKRLEEQHPQETKTEYVLPEKYTAEYMKPQTDAARLLAETYGVSTGSIKDSRTQRNALNYEQKYADMNFGERMLHNIPITAANYMLDMYSAGLTTADALTGGKLGRGELGDASSVYSLLNFAQNAGSGLTAEAFGVMRDSSNWLGKLVLDLEKTGVEQTMDRVLGAGTASLGMMGARVFGSGAQEAEDKGESLGKQIVTGFTRGGIEVATELMGGVGGSWRGTGYGDGVLKSLNSWVSSKTGSELLGTLTEAFTGEAIEEMMSDVLNPLADRIFQLSDGDQTFWQEVWGDGQILYDGLLGGLAGMGGGVQTHVGNWMQAKNLGTDIATYKAAQRIAESKSLRKKFEEYTGDKLDSDTDTAITQIAVAITNAADTAGETTNAHDVERDIESGGDRYRTTAAAEQTDSSAPPAPQTQSTPPAQTNTETGAQTTAQQTRPTGAMEAIYKGQVGNVVSLTKTDKGWAATIEQPNGKRSNAMEWQAVFDPDTQGILDAFRPSAYADEMLKTYALTDEQVEPKTYALAFNTVADIYGKSTSLTKQQAQEASRRDGGAAAILTDEQFSRAFDAGRNSKDSSIQNSVTRKSSKGAVGFKGVQYQGMTYRAATKDMVSDAELSVLKTMSKAVGVDMVLYQTEEQNGEYQGANGFYRNGTVYLDVHAGATKTTQQSAILLTAAHELTHYLRENNAMAYAGLRDFVTNHLIESGTDIETLAQRKIDREGGALSMEDAVEEVIADSCEMMLENTQVPQMMAKENPGLFVQIREWLAEFAAKLRRAFEGVQARSAEAQAMMQYAEELQQMWDNALAGAAQNVRNNAQTKANNANRSSDNKKGKASYGGRNAKTANLDALARAEQMEEQDTDVETIRRETGWFRGMDGKWRFEIDDSGMQFRRDGDAQLLKEEGYRRLQQLTEKWSAEVNGGAKLSESERQEMSRLEKEYGGAVWEEKYQLRDFVKHDELFEAYPYLNRVNIAFDSLPDGNMGYFSPRDMTIVLSDNLLGKEADVVLHEIQHVIQKREGFTDGASPSYWNTQLENGYDTRTRSQRRRAAELRNELESISVNEPEFFRDMTDLEGMTPTVPRGKVNWDTLEQIEEDPVEWQEYDARREALEEKYGDLKVFDFGELMYRYHEAEKYPDRTPRDLYYNTAGEIEARDVEARRTLTAEERRAKKPKGADDDTVFANRVGVSYSKNSDSDNSTIKNQIKNNLDKLNDMEPAATISASNLPKGGRNIRDWAVNILKNTGYKVERMGFGVIEFTPKHIAEGIKYLSEDAEVAAFSALPKVLKRGIVIDSHEKHKGNLRDSVTIAAPVIINGVRGNMAVAITVTTKNHYHVHRVLMPDGSKFTFDVGKKKTESTMYSAVNTGEETKDSAYESKISQPTGEVKGKSSMRERDEDLQKKYPKLNLNEDISELDGVPAVELTDGSVLPILDRDRYPTHVSFIEGNRIDVDDLRSGGWIGDGVYDPSFTSDTARYIERKKAGKRVAELRGVPFNQFEDNGKSSMRDNTTDDTAAERKGRQESYANLRAENAKLREQLDYWKGQTKRTKEKTVRKTDADAYAKRLTEQLHNPKAREQVADEIKRMGDYIVQTPGSELSYTEVKDWALAIADYVLQDSQTVIDDSQAESLQQLYGYLKDNKLRVTDDTFNDLPEGWVRQHRGRIKLSEDGLDVDTAWGELQEKFGEGMFPSDITAQADMLMHIADTIEAMKPTYGNPFAGYMGEMREAVAQDILDTVLSDEIRQTAMTAADRAQARLDKRIAQDTARYNALRDEKNARIEQVYQEGVARRQEAVAKEKAAKWAKVAETKQYYQNMAQQAAERRRESADIKKYRDRVAATAEQLSDWLLKNSDKEHVPEVLKQVVGEFLSTIDFSSKSRLQGGENTYNDRQFLQRLDKLEQMLRNQRDYLNSADNENAREDTLDMYLDLPAEILDELRDIRSEVTRLTTRDGGYTINQMPAGELRRLDAVLTAISHSIRKANTLFSNAQYNSVQQVAQTTIVEMDKLGAQTKETTGAGRFFQWDNATPYYAFKKLGAGARSIFKGLMQGWDKMAFNSKEIIDFTNKLYTAKEAREWQEKVHNVRIGNNTVQITTAQLMSLHCLVKRTQAMQHIMGGGFKVSVIKQSGIGKDNIAQTKQYKPTLEELAMLDGLLTDRQRKVADELQKFMVDVCGEWGNEVSMKRFGYRAFGEANYFPIVSDANVLKAVDPEAKANDMFRLLNMSATKSLNVKANNALVVSDIFEVFTNHSADMAKYNALALPLLDAIKWYNYKESTKTASGRVFTNTVQLSLETAYGNAAKAYITKFIKDLNGVREGGTSQSDKLAKRMVSRYKAAAVGVNIRVAIQQPTAYVRAAMAIDPKYLAAALKPGGHKASTAEMEKYSGIATWKGLGFVSTDIGRSMRSQIMHTESWVDSVTDKTMILAEKGDSVTWSALWRACKLETKDRTGLHGEELNKATADRFQEVIYQTQVVDATMTRSQAMRSQGTMEAITTSFMAEPTLSYNLMLDAYAEYQAEARRTGNKTAALQHSKGKLAKTIAIYAASGAATLIASSFWDAWRDDDDYETFLQKWAQAFFGEAEDKWYEKPLLQELFLLNKLPGVKDIISIITGDDVSRMDLEGAKNLIKAARIMEECLKLATGKLEEQDAQYGNMTGYGKLANILKGISQVTGLPLYNFTRDMAAIWNTTLSNVTGVKLTVYKPNSKREIKNAYVNGLMTDEQAMDELVKQGAADDADQAFWIINDWNGDGSSSDKMSEIYDAVRAGDTGTYDALVKELTDHGVFETKIQNDVKNQIRDWYQGGDTTQATISKQDALDMLQKYGGKAEKAADTLVEQWTCEKVTGISYWNIGDEYINGNISEARALELQAKYGYGDVTKQMPAEIASNKEEAHDKLMQWKLEKETGISAGGDSFTGIREAYNAGKISKQEVYDYRIKYAGDTPEQAANTAYRYEWIGGDTRMNSVTGNQAHRYDDYVAASGMSKIDYWNAIDGHGASSFPADLVEGSKTRYVKNSKRDKIWDYVDSLNLTPRQKDALATAYAYDVNADVKSTSAYFDFEDAPWNN